MEIKVLNKNDAQQMMTEWQSRYPDLPEVDSEWAHVRSDIQNINRTVRQQAEKLDTAALIIILICIWDWSCMIIYGK